jgi:hypothetical protein
MNIKTFVLALGIILAGLNITPLQADSCCHGHSRAGDLPHWLNQNWQGIVFGLVVLGPVQHFWNDIGSDYLKYLKRTYLDARKTHKSPDCCPCHDHV